LTLDPTIKPEWTEALKLNHGVLVAEKAIPPLDFDAWITDDYVKAAYSELGVDYEAEKAIAVDAKIANAGLPFEIWHSREGILTFDDAPSFLTALAGIQAEASKVNATYVYDVDTGLKLFGKTAFWVKSGDAFSTFLRKGEAEAYAASSGGAIIGFDEAILSFMPTDS
jgi:NitT/TauT family transport system substrate-binding protein